MITSNYINSKGYNFAKSTAGSNEYHAIDASLPLASDNDEIISVSWEIPAGITSDDDFLNGNIAAIKLNMPLAGSYEFIVTVNSRDISDNSKTQSIKTKIHLIVE